MVRSENEIRRLLLPLAIVGVAVTLNTQAFVAGASTFGIRGSDAAWLIAIYWLTFVGFLCVAWVPLPREVARTVVVQIETEARGEGATRVREALARIGLSADVQATYGRKSMSQLPPITQIVMSLPMFWNAFITPDVEEAAIRLATFLRDLGLGREHGIPSDVFITDDAGGVVVVLETDLPPKALQTLLATDPRKLRQRRRSRHWLVSYDRQTGNWVIRYPDGTAGRVPPDQPGPSTAAIRGRSRKRR